jgi:anti-anti-sigma factor
MQQMSDIDLGSSTSAELLQWFVEAESGATVVALVGEVDLSTAATLGGALERVIADRPATLIVDLRGLRFLDSTGIQCLLSASKVAATVGCRLVVRNPNPMIERIFKICGVAELLLEPTDGLERSDGAAAQAG